MVHGDYRIDDTILDAEGATRVRVVLDGELSTVGDPVSDAARVCGDRDPMVDVIVDITAGWTCALLPSGDALAHRYSVARDQPLAHWDFCLPLAYVRAAIIAAGIDVSRRPVGSDHTGDRVGETPAPIIAGAIAKPTAATQFRRAGMSQR